MKVYTIYTFFFQKKNFRFNYTASFAIDAAEATMRSSESMYRILYMLDIIIPYTNQPKVPPSINFKKFCSS